MPEFSGLSPLNVLELFAVIIAANRANDQKRQLLSAFGLKISNSTPIAYKKSKVYNNALHKASRDKIDEKT